MRHRCTNTRRLWSSSLWSLAFLLTYRFLRTNRKTLLFFASICLGLGFLTVPTMLPLVPLLGLSPWSSRIQEAIIRVVVLFVVLSIPVGSWVVRNYRAYDEVILVNQAAGLNLGCEQRNLLSSWEGRRGTRLWPWGMNTRLSVGVGMSSG